MAKAGANKAANLHPKIRWQDRLMAPSRLALLLVTTVRDLAASGWFLVTRRACRLPQLATCPEFVPGRIPHGLNPVGSRWFQGSATYLD